MSDTILKIISTSPTFQPDNKMQDNAKALLSKFYSVDQVDFISTNEIEFVDQGQNFEQVICNLCGQDIEIDEWQEAMENAHTKQFADLTITTPCCNKATSLNELNYKWPAGFSKFVICITNPVKEISKSEISRLEEIFESPLRIIWAHY